MNYRAEIDGLRALAVLPVMLFHAGYEWFRGGFVGVDVFFVISGYLITTIILTEITEEKFSIVGFYERRARRILPALFFVMTLSLPFAYWWLTPADLQDFGQSLVAVSTFSSNFLFWTQSGYFDTAAELKPLLHTWSLAVEEQYYILFPIFMLLTWPLGVRYLLLLLILVFLSSLGVAEWATQHANYPNRISGAFYLLPARVWELLIGVFTALYLRYRSHFQSRYINQLLSSVGLVMIVVSILAFDKQTPFPSLYALVPTVGAGLVILTAVKETLVHYLLTNRLLVGIGLVSYSAYLWHQPLLAFERYKSINDQQEPTFVIPLLASLIMAWFSWRFVERPFRSRVRFDRRAIFKFSIIGAAFFSAIGLLIDATNGLEKLKLLSYSEGQRRIYHSVKISTNYNLYDRMYSSDCKMWGRDYTDLSSSQLESCLARFGGPVIVLGDSHAMNLYNIFGYSEVHDFVIGLAQGGCRPHTKKSFCHFDSSFEFLKTISAYDPIIVYHQASSYFFTDEDGIYQPSKLDNILFDSNNVNMIHQYLEKLSDLNLDIIWLGGFPEYGVDPSNSPFRILNLPRQNLDVFEEIDEKVVQHISGIGGKDSYFYVSFNDFYQITEQVMFSDCMIWRDRGHFSSCGEMHIAENANWSLIQPLQSNE